MSVREIGPTHPAFSWCPHLCIFSPRKRIELYLAKMYSKCSRWVDKRCSGIKGSQWHASSFKCAVCVGAHVSLRENGKSVWDESLKCVDEFYSGDGVIGARSGAETSSVARVLSGWKKIKELLPLVTLNRLSLRAEGTKGRWCKQARTNWNLNGGVDVLSVTEGKEI